MNTAAKAAVRAGQFLAVVYLTAMALLVATVLVASLVAGWSAHVVVSGSMQPTFSVGDVVLVEPAQEHDWYDEPTVVTFDAERGTVTHRVIRTQVEDGEMFYTTQGDANEVPESTPVPHHDVIGAVEFAVPAIGLPVVWVQTGQWLWFIAWALTVVAAVWTLPSPVRSASRTDAAAAP